MAKRAIIVGAGVTTESLLEDLTKWDLEIVVIDLDKSKLDRLTQKYDILALEGDATDIDVLREAGAEKADLFLANTDTDSTNFMLSYQAYRVLGIPKVVASIRNPKNLGIFKELGTSIPISTTRAATDALLGALVGFSSFQSISKSWGIGTYTVTHRSPLANQSPKDFPLPPEQAFIASVVREGEVVREPEDIQLVPGDVLVIFANKSHLGKLAPLLR